MFYPLPQRGLLGVSFSLLSGNPKLKRWPKDPKISNFYIMEVGEMALPTFRKGVHPPHGKGHTEECPVQWIDPGSELVFPMAQHIGAPCKPLVKKGDRVLVGQKIGDNDAYVSAPIHSSVSGIVKEVSQRLVASGAMDTCVVVENDGQYELDPSISPRPDWEDLPADEIRRIIREAGIVGMGGACFPTAVKLTPPPDKKVDHVIINGAECEPYLTCDDRLMRERGDRVLLGLQIALKLFPQGVKGVVALEDNKPKAIEAMRGYLDRLAIQNVTVQPVRTKYPQGAEKMLIYAVTGREVPVGGLPADVGCIILNVRTAYAIWDAVVNRMPVIDRIVTVSGDAIKEPKNLGVRLGMSVRELIEACGGFSVEPLKVIMGGPMMGVALSDLNVPVVKGTSGILAFSEALARLGEEENCIRCGKCVSTCPMGLLPYQLNAEVLRRNYDEFERLGGMNCIECGCCAYACPARRHLTQSCRDGKRTILARRRKGGA